MYEIVLQADVFLQLRRTNADDAPLWVIFLIDMLFHSFRSFT